MYRVFGFQFQTVTKHMSIEIPATTERQQRLAHGKRKLTRQEQESCATENKAILLNGSANFNVTFDTCTPICLQCAQAVSALNPG